MKLNRLGGPNRFLFGHRIAYTALQGPSLVSTYLTGPEAVWSVWEALSDTKSWG